MTTSDTIELHGDELNRRLQQLSLRIERVSMLLEDAMVDPSDVISIDRSRYNDLVLCLSKYEELLGSFQESTEETAEEVREIAGREECFAGERDEDEEIDVFDDDEEDEP